MVGLYGPKNKNKLTIVSLPMLSMALSIGNELSRNISSLLLKAVTLSSKRPLPNCSFEQSNRMMVGFCLNLKHKKIKELMGV